LFDHITLFYNPIEPFEYRNFGFGTLSTHALKWSVSAIAAKKYEKRVKMAKTVTVLSKSDGKLCEKESFKK